MERGAAAAHDVAQLLSLMPLPSAPISTSTIAWPVSVAHVHPHEVSGAADDGSSDRATFMR